MNLYQIIQQLRNTSGSNDKLAILQANKDNELLKAYFKAMLDPAINYYMTKLPKQKGDSMTTMDLELIDWLVTNLAGRVYTGKIAEARLKGVMSCLDDEGLELLGYIIKRKIDGANVGETMVLKTWPGLFFVVPYMRCAGMDDKVKAHYTKYDEFYVQTKYDSMFGYLVKHKNGSSSVITRQGSKFPDKFASALAQELPPNSVLIGELEVYRDGESKPLDRATGNGLLNSLLKSGEMEPGCTVVMTAWDYITEDEFQAGKSQMPYKQRLINLANLLGEEVEA